MDIKISVILPSLNVKKYITECIESVLQQTLQEIEIICVDAGSTDGTLEILEEYSKKDNRIVLIYSDKKSYGYQMNLGIKRAKGQYIGIVETDDYIERTMYEELYHIAKTNEVDYVKANFYTVATFSNGSYNITPINQFSNKDLYNQPIVPKNQMDIFLYDATIWKGIYKTSFLRENNIVFHETKGASYQDLGFGLQVFYHAKKAWYSDEYYYYYRVDRDEASSCSPNVLRYIYQEFTWLLENKQIDIENDEKYKQKFYMRMLVSFVGECKKLALNSDWIQKNREYYSWFVSKIKQKSEVFSKENTKIHLLDHVGELLQEPEQFTKIIQNNSLFMRREKILLKLQETGFEQFIIFGAGIRGRNLYALLDGKIDFIAFCDNDSSKWNKTIGGIVIQSLEDCLKYYPDACYLIANKNNGEQIGAQLCRYGVMKNKIIQIIY